MSMPRRLVAPLIGCWLLAATLPAPERLFAMKSVVVSSRLSPAQVDRYRREGYLIYPEPVFPEEKFRVGSAPKEYAIRAMAVVP